MRNDLRQSSRGTDAYRIISSLFCVSVVLSNIVSAKMVRIALFRDLTVPAGLIIYPITFFISDLVTEVYGVKNAKKMIYHAFGMSIFAYLIIEVVIILPSANGYDQRRFEEVLGLNGILLFASLTAYLCSQILDVRLYALIKNRTGRDRLLWLRNNGSTLIAQIVDTVIVDTIYLQCGVGLELAEILPIMTFSYAYKCTCSVFLTPIFYIFYYIAKKKLIVLEYIE
ncbi:MAG: queuosine precursor transporter [Simkaniaceae bacterium]|nr:queuosine precursor transporter [Simkaniaceae bacterium]